MINPKELRIGNETSFGKVYQIEEDCFYTIKDEVSYKSKWAAIEPITLTPEILEKCGFDKLYSLHNRFTKDYGNFYFEILEQSGESVWHIRMSNDSYKGTRVGLGLIYYVHELQNLYFSLTGKELEIAF